MATFFDRLKRGLTRTRATLTEGVRASLGRGPLDAERADALERLLIQADVGVLATERLLERLAERGAAAGDADLEAVLRDEMVAILEGAGPRGDGAVAADTSHDDPHVVMVIGVNGVGKTTTIGKLAHGMQTAGRSVLIGSCDTFRAAAGDQLEIWAQRAGSEIVRQRDGADPAAVAFDTLVAAQSRGTDVVLLDTAGRLHNKANLMAELAKIHRVIGRRLPGAPHEVLLCLDATTGQNGIRQAREFNAALGVTGLVLTKLDGTARGGVVVAIAADLGLPVAHVGVGEAIDDLIPFDARTFVDALFADEEAGP
jgi:fused signal recognition particle receptor